MASKRASEKNSESPPKKKLREPHQVFLVKYTEAFPCLVASGRGESFVFCKVCRSHFSVKHGGINDCSRHVESKKHKDLASLLSKNHCMTKFLGTSNKDEDEKTLQVTRAEVVMTELIATYNLPLSFADSLTKAVKTVFPDSDIAQKYQCGRAKTTAITKELAVQCKNELIRRMRELPFTISTDGSNDVSAKQFPLVARTVNTTTFEVKSDVLAVPTLAVSATGENIFKLIQTEFQNSGIPWSNCLALGADNANVMTGKQKGVFAFCQKEQPPIYMAGCVCHLIHICAQKAAACLPVKLDELLIDVFYYLDKSSVRQKAFSDMQLKHEIKGKILKHVATRWLSVSKCLPRLLDNWNALKDFVKEEMKSRKGISSSQADRLQRLYDTFRSPTALLYLKFLQEVLQMFDAVNTILQCEEPKVHILKRTLQKLLKDLFLRFLKPVAMHGKLILDIQFEPTYHHRSEKDLLIGDQATQFIANADKNSLRAERIKEFYSNAIKFFVAACSYLKTKLPMNDELLQNAEVADTREQLHSKSSSVKYFIEKFPCMLPKGATSQSLLVEFALYQTTVIPTPSGTERMDHEWKKIGEMKDCNGSLMFTHLPLFMLFVLTIPHSSAHCERVFSCVRKNKTDQRANLGEKTLEALLILKSQPEDALMKTYSKESLKQIKSCYYESLKKNV